MEHKEKGTAKVCANSGKVGVINTSWSHAAVNGTTVLTGVATLGGFANSHQIWSCVSAAQLCCPQRF